MGFIKDFLNRKKYDTDFTDIKKLLNYIKEKLFETGTYPVQLSSLFEAILGKNGTMIQEKKSAEKYQEAANLKRKIFAEKIPLTDDNYEAAISEIRRLKKESQNILESAEKSELGTLVRIKTIIKEIVKDRKVRSELISLCEFGILLSEERYTKAKARINSLIV